MQMRCILLEVLQGSDAVFSLLYLIEEYQYTLIRAVDVSSGTDCCRDSVYVIIHLEGGWQDGAHRETGEGDHEEAFINKAGRELEIVT